MITPEKAGLGNNTSDIDHARKRLEDYIDFNLTTIVANNGMISFSLSGRLDKYKSNDPNESFSYNFYSDILMPVIKKYQKGGWFVYCRRFHSFIQRDDLHFCQKQNNIIKGFNIRWDIKGNQYSNPRVVSNTSDFYFAEFETLKAAQNWLDKLKRK